jgi:hypothetical protein
MTGFSPSAVRLRDWHCDWRRYREYAEGEDRGEWPVCPECGHNASVAVDDGTPWPEFLARVDRDQKVRQQMLSIHWGLK